MKSFIAAFCSFILLASVGFSQSPGDDRVLVGRPYNKAFVAFFDEA